MRFGTYFRLTSYGMIGAGALALLASHGIGLIIGGLFFALLVFAWKLEGTKWQLSDRVGLVIVLLSLPLFYLDWKFLENVGLTRELVGVTALAHLILFLAAVKILQRKTDRDWVFLYLISFFEILLAAGLSISPLFMLTLLIFLLCAFCTIVAFEMRKTQRQVPPTNTHFVNSAAPRPLFSFVPRRARRQPAATGSHGLRIGRLPWVSLTMLGATILLALPLFFIMPRFGSVSFARNFGGGVGLTGFSETVRLGAIGELKRSDEIVMRVRVENTANYAPQDLRWRGIALDQFDGLSWSRADFSNQYVPSSGTDDFFVIRRTQNPGALVEQTFYLEPVSTSVLFATPHATAVRGKIGWLRADEGGSLQTRARGEQRFSYKAFSDMARPAIDVLRADPGVNTANIRKYLQLPDNFDPRIATLARQITTDARATNRYDAARAVENYLQTQLGYTLELKAGGDDPLSDFLFRVREGHCEYFSSAMAIMLRSQGIPARVVNGFQAGAYNDAADAFTVRQSDAHSWVEVYFPATDTWLTFDPTPAAGRSDGQRAAGITAQLSKYADALELLWIQYVVGYDREEQRTLTQRLGERAGEARKSITAFIEKLQNFFQSVADAIKSGDFSRLRNADKSAIWQLATFLLILAATIWLLRRFAVLQNLRALFAKRQTGKTDPRRIVEFYERMTRVLALRGLKRETWQTPLEFATATGMDIPVKITDAYHRVRYGEEALSSDETARIENWLSEIETENQGERK